VTKDSHLILPPFLGYFAGSMRSFFFALIFCILSTGLVRAQQAFGTRIDASQFNKGDICLDIQAAIASLPAAPSGPTPGGALIDARNFAPPSSQTFIHCGYNPFAVFNAPTNPIELVNQGSGTAACTVTAGGTAGCWGGVLLLPGFVISADVPWLVPGNWSIIGQGGKVTVVAPSTLFSTNLASYVTGNVTGTAGANTVTVSGTGASWSANMVGMVFTACPISGVCNAPATSYSNATAVGIVTKVVPSTQIQLGSNLQSTLTNTPLTYYTLQAPVMAWATTCTSVSGCPGPLQNYTFGSVIQDVGLSCVINAGGGTSPVSGCIPFWDEYGQERSQLKRISVSGFLGLGIGIYTSNAQNGGPFEDIQMTSGPTAIVAGTTCVEVGGTGGNNSAMGQPSMRGIRGLTCTNMTGAGTTGDGMGVDINTQNFSLSDAHFEDNSIGVEIGDVSSARGIWLSDITGGTAMGTVVDVSVNCASSSSGCGTFATSDLNVSNVFKSTSTATFVDNINGNTATEATLGFYSLGDGSGGPGASTRPIATTSSSLQSNLNLSAFQLSGISISGVQGTANKLQLSSATSTTLGDVPKYDLNGNLTDSGLSTQNATYWAWCNGTIGTSGTGVYALMPFITSTSSLSCTNTLTTATQMPISATCTARNLYVTATAMGVNGNSGDVVVYKDGSPTSLLCKLGIGMACNDTTDAIPFTTTDTIAVVVKPGAAGDTTANVRASFQCQ
jgi:hypothetical protein